VRVLHERLVPGSIPARAGEPSSAERRAFVRGSIPARAGEPRPYRRGAAYRLYASIFLQIDDLDGGADKLGRMFRLQSLGGGAAVAHVDANR
jgi:hypothetical protein